MARKENTKAKEKKRERKLMEMKLNLGWDFGFFLSRGNTLKNADYFDARCSSDDFLLDFDSLLGGFRRRLKVKVKVMLRWGKVKSAESQENPLEALPSFTVFNKNGVKFSLETKK